MTDSFTESSSTGWFGRIRESIKGLLFGFVLFAVSFPVLWFNEKNSAETIAGLNQLVEEAVTVESNAVDSTHEGKPIHTVGRADTEELLRDGRFGVTAAAIKLVRHVEMYQWEEHEETEENKKLGGGSETVTTYTYEKVWSDQQINSSQFNPQGRAGHENPPMPYQNETIQAKDVSLGAFVLSPFLVAQMNDRVEYDLDPAQREALPADMRTRLKNDGAGYYEGNPSAPQVGDLRTRFFVVQPDTVSVIATQIGTTFGHFIARNGKKFGLLEMGQQDKENVIKAALDRNLFRTWGFRLLGFILMLIGLALILRPFSVLADVIPLVGYIVGVGTGMIAAIIAAALSLMTIALAWFVYRPLIGIPLAMLSIGLIVFLVMRIAKQRKSHVRRQPAAVAPRRKQAAVERSFTIPLPASTVVEDLKVSCPHCGQHIQYETAHYGLNINCPACEAQMLLPTAVS
jgi:hypothetical protein